MIGVSIGHDDLLPRSLDHGRRDLAERAPVDVGRLVVDEPGFHELSRDERDATRLVDVGRDDSGRHGLMLATTGVARRRGRSPRAERNAELAGDREEVQDAIGRAAGRGDRRRGVLECLPRDDLGRTDVAPDELHHEPPRLGGRLRLFLG